MHNYREKCDCFIYGKKKEDYVVKTSFFEKIKWKLVKVKSTIYPVCTVFMVISLIAIIMICNKYSPDSIINSLGNSIFTGIIASIIVSVIIQIKQDKEQFERKRAILFDAGFYLKKFEKEYTEKKKNYDKLDEDWKLIFELCKEPAQYLSELYKTGLDILDVVDISLLRSINSKYSFIITMCKEINIHVNDKKFLRDPVKIQDVWNKYNKEIKELKKDLLFLLIKWEKDSIVD